MRAQEYSSITRFPRSEAEVDEREERMVVLMEAVWEEAEVEASEGV